MLRLVGIVVGVALAASACSSGTGSVPTTALGDQSAQAGQVAEDFETCLLEQAGPAAAASNDLGAIEIGEIFTLATTCIGDLIGLKGADSECFSSAFTDVLGRPDNVEALLGDLDAPGLLQADLMNILGQVETQLVADCGQTDGTEIYDRLVTFVQGILIVLANVLGGSGSGDASGASTTTAAPTTTDASSSTATTVSGATTTDASSATTG